MNLNKFTKKDDGSYVLSFSNKVLSIYPVKENDLGIIMDRWFWKLWHHRNTPIPGIVITTGTTAYDTPVQAATFAGSVIDEYGLGSSGSLFE